MTLCVAALHPIFVEDVVHAIVVGGKEFTDGFPPVEEEIFSSLGRTDDLSSEGRHPGA